MAKLMEFIEQWGQNIITKFNEKPWIFYLIMAIIIISLLLNLGYIILTEWKEK